MMADMSTSLNVVNIAVSFLALTRRRAMVRRIRLIFRRSSSRLKAAGATFSTTGAAGAGEAGAAGGAETAFCASSFVMRPSLPVPLTAEAGMPFSFSIFAAAGEGCPVAWDAAAGIAGTSGATAGAAAGAGATALGTSDACTLVSIRATRAPISRSSPSLATYMSLPAASAGNSRVALSDSNSQIGSSSFTIAPSSFNQRERVTSLMDSPTDGTRISTRLIAMVYWFVKVAQNSAKSQNYAIDVW